MNLRNLFLIDNKENLKVFVLGKTILTYYQHIIMKIERKYFLTYCPREDLVVRGFTSDVLDDMKKADFGAEYIKTLKEKYVEKFYGFALYKNNEICGYICGLRPKSEEIQYRIRKCEFFVKYVYVFEKFRGQRIASELFSHLFLNISENSIVLAVRKNNTSAIKAYRRIGGESISEKKFMRIFKLKIPYHKV